MNISRHSTEVLLYSCQPERMLQDYEPYLRERTEGTKKLQKKKKKKLIQFIKAKVGN